MWGNIMSQPDPGNDPNKRTIMVDGQPVDLDTFMQMQSGVGGPIPMPKKRRSSGGCGIVIIILLLVLVPIVLVGIFASNILNSVTSSFGGLGSIGDIVSTVSSAMEPPESQSITGDASEFDPMVGLAQAQEMAGEDARLATIDATYVRADGTMDLTATYSPAPRINIVGTIVVRFDHDCKVL
jgi:hypothetical protein